MTVKDTKIAVKIEDLVSVPQTTKELGVNFTTIYRRIDKGKIHCFHIRNQVFVTADEVRALKK